VTKAQQSELDALESRRKDHHSFLLIGLAMGIVDVLGIVKDLSLKFQTVNQLPWELYQSTKETHAVLVMCAEQLHAGVVPNEHFPFLTKDNDETKYTWAEFQTGKFCGVPLDLAPLDEAWGAVKAVRELLASLCAEVAVSIQKRLLAKYPAEIKEMASCLDLRVLCGAVPGSDTQEALRQEAVSLKKLHTWAKDEGKLQLAPFAEYWTQHRIVKEKLQSLYKTEEFGQPRTGKWVNASGVEIMEYMFTNPSFFANPNQPVRQWLYLFTHCILKSRNEAVVEGMGCALDNHAAPGRHLQMEQFTAEAMIHWNGPAAHQCENFLTLALNDYFGPTACVRVNTSQSVREHI